MTSSTGELLVGDTSFISVLARPEEGRGAVLSWPRGLVRRVSSATVAISAVTFADAVRPPGRALGRPAGEGGRTMAAHIRATPVDTEVAETWARLKATGQRRGCSFGANDLWIAATGCTRGLSVVTCDRGFLPMRKLGVQVIYLPRDGTSGKS